MPSSVPIIMQDVIVIAKPVPPMRTATASAAAIAVQAARSRHRAASVAAGTVATIVSSQPKGRKRVTRQIAITRSTRSAASTISTVRSRCRARGVPVGCVTPAAAAGTEPAGTEPAGEESMDAEPMDAEPMGAERVGREPAVGGSDKVVTVSSPVRWCSRR